MEKECYDTLTEINPNLSKCECICKNQICESDLTLPKESDRKKKMFNIVTSTENYLKERRIPELIRFLLTKIVAQAPDKPVAYLENLLDDCMLFRAGHGLAPTLYETRHLQAAITSFDPGQSGWLSAGQIRRLYASLGLETETKQFKEDRTPVTLILEDLIKTQELVLYQLLSSGTENENIEKCFVH